MLNMHPDILIHVLPSHHSGTGHGASRCTGYPLFHGLNARGRSDLILIVLADHGEGIHGLPIRGGHLGIIDLQGHPVIEVQLRSDIASIVVNHLRHKGKSILTSDIVHVIHGKMAAVRWHLSLIQIGQILHQ